MGTAPEQHIETKLPRGAQALLDSPYARYLGLETIYDIQVANHAGAELHHPEEFVFRSVHMVSETWLRLAGLELDRLVLTLDRSDVAEAVRLAGRAERVVCQVIEATSILTTLAATAYHQFRVQLGTASGLQSPGYGYVRHAGRKVAERLDELVGDDDALFDLYTHHRDDRRYDLCEALLDLDASIDRFRSLHLQIAKRFLGEMTAGTGGEGIDYLRNNLEKTIFPRLWALRGRIAEASDETNYGYGNVESES